MENNDNNIAIKVEHVSKTFKLPHEKAGSIKNALLNFSRHKKGYEKQHVLDNINFEIKKGEFFGIVGRNGSGKSTLLKLLAGIYTPDSGNIEVNGKLTPFIELGVGFNPELTGRENVFLNGALLGFNRKEMTAMYDEIVEFAELERFMDQKLKNYSSGMQVRLAFSIAIQAQSSILILDEVLAVGDAAFQRKCYDYFMSLKEEKRTVLLVTHDMGAVRQFCSQAIMINEGRIVESGSPEEIAQSYQKLFVDEAKNTKTDYKPGSRWGEGGVTIKPAFVELGKDEIRLTTVFKIEKEINSPIFGFTIFNQQGDNILESNTKRLHKKTKKVLKGESVTIQWSIPNILKSGKYKVSIACCDETASHYYEWLNQAATFDVFKAESTSSIVDPEILINDAQGI